MIKNYLLFAFRSKLFSTANVLSCLLVFVGFTLKAQMDTIPLTAGTRTFIQSKIAGEKFEAWIRLPEDFNNAKDSVSLLILLDGDEYFKMASDVVRLVEYAEKMPPTVIVGLPSTLEGRWKYYTPTNEPYKGKPNSADSLLYSLSGKFNLFADFLHKELIPIISTRLKANFVSKTIFGHSNGGLGAMSFYVLRPEIFDNYIIASPGIHWDNYYLQRKLESKIRTNSVYMTLGATGDYRVDYFSPFVSKLKKTNNNFRFVENVQEEHSTNGLRTLLDGLEYVYTNNKK
jgi:predicted alpha/beta superfamily hydrolase